MNNISIVGNLVRDPELRFGASGKPRATFTVAINERRGEEEITHFLFCSAFGSLAENICETLRKGHRVVAVGRFNTWDSELTLEGGDQKRISNVGITVSAIGPDLLWARARVAKVDRPPAEDGESASAPAPAPAPAPAAAPVQTDSDDDEPSPPLPPKPRAKATVPDLPVEEEPF